MATTIKRMYLAQPGTSNGTLYTVPASTKAIIKQIIICNTTGSAATLTVNVVPNAGSVNANNRIMSAVSFAANSITTIDLSIALDTAGDTLQGLQGTASALTINISGVELT